MRNPAPVLTRVPQTVRRLILTRLAPFAIPFMLGLLSVLAFAAIVAVFLRPDDAVIVEVVPIRDEESVQVQVAGSVSEPGVYTAPPGGTVADAIELAGGVVAQADLGSLDVSAPLVDGQFIFVPTTDTVEPGPVEPIDINMATAAELEALPGVGPVIAGRIVEHREALGGFTSVDQLVEVSGISERMVGELRSLLSVADP